MNERLPTLIALSLSELYFRRSIHRDDEKGTVIEGYWLSGKARVQERSANEEEPQELFISLRRWSLTDNPRNSEMGPVAGNPKGAPTAPTPSVLGGTLWEDGGDWCAEVYLPQSLFDELAAACRRGALATVALKLFAELWLYDGHRHTLASVNGAWYLAPQRYAGFHFTYWLTLFCFEWSEKPFALK